MMLAYSLVRRGLARRLLETLLEFHCDIRGGTVHPSSVEILDSRGLADHLLALQDSFLRRLEIKTLRGTLTVTDFTRLTSRDWGVEQSIQPIWWRSGKITYGRPGRSSSSRARFRIKSSYALSTRHSQSGPHRFETSFSEARDMAPRVWAGASYG
jgi:hypothetical protein